MSSLNNKTFVFSGKIPNHTRKSIGEFVVLHGGEIAAGLSKKVDYLVGGARMGNSKREKANTYGIPILTFDEFMSMLEPQTNESSLGDETPQGGTPKDVKNAKAASHLKGAKVTKKKGKGWPTTEGKTYDDIIEFGFVTLADLGPDWDGHLDDYLFEIALCELQKGRVDSVSRFMNAVTGRNKNEFNAEIAFHLLARGHEKEGKKYLQLAETSVENAEDLSLCNLHTYIMAGHHFLGEEEKVETHLNLAVKHCMPEANEGQNGWPLVSVLLVIGKDKEAYKYMKKWDLSDSSYTSESLYNLIWYGTFEQLFKLKKYCAKNDMIDEDDIVGYFSKKVISDNAYDRVNEVYLAFKNSPYQGRFIKDVLNAMQKEGLDLFETGKHFFAEEHEDFREEWVDCLTLILKSNPDFVKNLIEKRKWTLEEAKSWGYYRDSKLEIFFQLGKIIGSVGLLSLFEKELNEVDEGFQASFFAGVASSSEEGEAFLEQAAVLLRAGETGDYHVNIWHMVAVASFSCTSVNAEAWLKEAIDYTLTKDKTLDMDRLAITLSKAGAISSTYKVWMKIPKRSRGHRVESVLKVACTQKNYNALHQILAAMDAKDLNDCGQSIAKVLTTLTNSRGYRLS